MEGFQGTAEFQAVTVGQHQVEKHQIGLAVGENGTGGSQGVGGEQGKAVQSGGRVEQRNPTR